MDDINKNKKFIEKLKDTYRLVIYNEQNYKKIFQVKLNQLNLFSATTGLLLIFIFLIFAIIAYTPVRELIPGYPDGSMRRNIILNAKKVDSLEYEIKVRDQYFTTLNTIISGKEPENIEDPGDTSFLVENVDLERSFDDSIFRKQIEEEEQFNLALSSAKKINNNISGLHFFAPVKGIVTNKFNAHENHFGTDIVSATSEVVKAALPGTVTLSAWTLETGYIIQIQHEHNLVSVYKHNAELLKKVGNHVEAGEPIAIIGNSGELTTGPHLHFELWHNGTPLDPEDYILF